MKSQSLKDPTFLLITAVVSSIFFSAVSHAAETVVVSSCKPLTACEAHYNAVNEQDIGMGGMSAKELPNGHRSQGELVEAVGNAKAAVACPAIEVCKAERKKCNAQARKPFYPLCVYNKHCKRIDEIIGALVATCETGHKVAVDGAITKAAAQSEGAPPSQGRQEVIKGLLWGAAAGAGVAFLMNRNRKDDDDSEDLDYNGALQPNGSIDCSKPDAIFYRDCNTQNEARCITMLDEPTCQQFSTRFCGPAGGGAPLTLKPEPPPGVNFQVDPKTLLGAPGEGMASGYCKGVVAWNYCKGPGRETCPSCQAISKNQSAACAQNPALCLAQNSKSELDKAKLSCPTDPAFSDPTLIGGASPVGTPPDPNTPDAGLPAVILPQSTGRGVATVSTSYGPAPDVDGQFGASLFSASTQAIRKRCQAGKLNNCP